MRFTSEETGFLYIDGDSSCQAAANVDTDVGDSELQR
jgi:hypothetical protein